MHNNCIDNLKTSYLPMWLCTRLFEPSILSRFLGTKVQGIGLHGDYLRATRYPQSKYIAFSVREFLQCNVVKKMLISSLSGPLVELLQSWAIYWLSITIKSILVSRTVKMVHLLVSSSKHNHIVRTRSH